MIDLHTHTNKSDGQYTPSEVVTMAAARGISILAITDHDTVSGLAEGEARAAELRITFVPAIEISVEGNRDLHILGYYIDYADASLLQLCENFMYLRTQREGRIFNYLRAYGVAPSEEQVKRYVTQGTAGRPHFARAMVEAGYAATVQDAFDRYLGTPEFDAIERSKPPARDGIEAIMKAGGVPVLAHPALLKLNDKCLDALLYELSEYGLAGMECYYSMHSGEQTSRYLELAHKHGLLVTCGSDFHGEQTKPGVELGDGSRGLKEQNIQDILSGLKSCYEKNLRQAEQPR